MKKKWLAILGVSSLCAVAMGTGFAVSTARAEVEIVENPVLATYELYDAFEIPEATLSYGGETAKGQGRLIMPDGTLIDGNSAVLSQSGEYSIVYTAEIAGETRSYTVTFEVEIPLASPESKTSNVYYGSYSYANEVQGLSATLYSGDSFVYNKILNVNELDDSDTLIRFFSDAATQRILDCSVLTVTLTDAYDPNNYISATLTYASEYWVYATATRPGQPNVGANRRYEATTNEYVMSIMKNRHGSEMRFSFGSTQQYGTSSMADSWGEFNYDAEEKALYLTTHEKVIHSRYGGYHQMIADFDDLDYFSEKWSGFTTGDVILSLQASSYSSGNPAKFFISKIADEDLSLATFKDEFAPVIEVKDYGYTEIPYGVVGQAYPVFDYVASDIQSGVRSASVSVYKDYGLSTQEQVTLQNGIVVPQQAGTHTVEYCAVDYFGNEKIELVTFEVLETANDIFVNVSEKGRKYNAHVGEIVSVASATTNGGSGNKTLEGTAILLDGDIAYPIENGKFQPMKAGSYYVQYTATDYIGNQKSAGYIVEVTLSSSAVFENEPILPLYFFENFEYTLPTLVGYNYSTGNKVAEYASVSVTDKNGTKTLTDSKFTPAVNESFDTVTVRYYIGENELVYEVPCIQAYKSGKFDKLGYFVHDDKITSQSGAGNASFTTSENEAKFWFANSLIANGANMTLDVDASKNAFNRLNVYLTDSDDLSKTVKISYEKNETKKAQSYFSVNDGDKFNVNMSFYGESISSFYFIYLNSNYTVGDGISNSLVVTNYMNGEPFDGFASGKIYIAFEFEGVTGESCVKLKNLNNTPINNKSANTAFPEFAVKGSYGGSHSVGSDLLIPEAVAASVFNPEVSVTFSVLTPSGEYATATDGTLLKNVKEMKAYYVKATTYGGYEVRYTAVDSLGKENAFSYVMTVEDAVPPVFESVSVPQTAKVGEKITVPKITASDEVGNTKVGCCYITPSWDMVFIKMEDSFTVSEKGKYIIRYMAFDESGNITLKDYEITVE